MAAPGGTHCNHAGCYCKAWVEPTSKWSKGKCKKCNHSQKEHGELTSDVSFDSDKIADAPISNNSYSGQIDGKMGIVPSGKTNYKDVGGGNSYKSGAQQQSKSIYSIHLNESDWINWSADDLLVWLQQKKKFPQELDLKSIEHEMRTNNINGSKITQLTHSSMLSYGFKDYNHRSKLLDYIKQLKEQYPSSQQTPKYNNQQQQQQQQQQQNYNDNNKKKDDQKQMDKDEIELMKEANLNESQWKSWSTDDVWNWIKIKQGWWNYESLEYLVVHKLNEYEQKLKSNEVNLTGAKFIEVQQDIKTQKLLKGIGFPFSARKAIYKHIDALIRHYPN